VILLRTLGEVGVETTAGRLSSRRKELSLLTYLARRAPRPVARAELAALLWEGIDEGRARQSLRQALLELKRVVGDGLVTDGEQVRLDPAGVRVDATAFESAIVEGRPAEAVAWWKGDFLAGLEQVGGEAFRTWLEVEREGLRQNLARALDRLIGGAAERGDWDEATAWAERWTELLPLDERGHRNLVEALRLAGRPAEARARYTAAVARLRSELEIEPGPELRLAGEKVERAAAGMTPGHRPGSAALFTPDLVGRGPALAELEAAWASCRSGQLTAVVIEGETGIGKTRLVEEFLRGAGIDGDGVIALMLPSGSRETAARIAHTVFAGLALAPGLGAASPAALATVIAQYPKIGARFPALTGSEDGLPVEDAVAEALTAVAEDRPVVVFVDDLELADDSALSLLTVVARRARGRVLIVTALGTDHHSSPTALASLTGTPGVRRLKLPPLSAGEVEALIASMLVLTMTDRHTLATRLQAEGGGNPLYTIELVAALVDEGVLAVGEEGSWQLVHAEGWRAPLPTGLRAIVASRLAHLGDEARSVAQAMAGLGPEVPETAARAAANLPTERFDLGRDELVTRRLIRLAPRQSGVFQFSHELVRRVVLDAGSRPAPEPAPQQARPAPARRRAGRMLLAAALVLAATGSGAVAFRYLAARSPAPEPEGPDIVVAPPVLAAGATRPESLAALTLRLAIDRAVPYRQLSAPAMRAALARMRSRDTIGPPDEPTARELAVRTGTRLLVVPSVTSVSDQLTVTYRLADPETGRTLKLRQAEASPSEPTRKAVARLVEPLEDDVAAASRRMPKRDPLPEVTTSSLDALRHYAVAKQLISRGDAGWVPLLHRAIELDSTFAVPYGLLAYEYWFSYDQKKAAVYADAGERLARSLPDRERLQVMLDVANAREDWPAAIANARNAVAQDRTSPSKWLALAQLYYFDGQYSRAVEAYDSSAARYAPARLPPLLMNQATVLARVGREREAAALYEEGFAAESSLVRHPFLSHEYGVTLVRLGRIADARAAYRRRMDDVPSGRAGGLRSLAMLEAHLGHFAVANQLLTDAEAASSASDDTLGTATTHLLRAEVQLARGRRVEALSDLAALERIAARRPLPYEVLTHGVKLLSRLGATSRAEALLRRVESQTTAVSRGARARLLMARGELLLARGRLVEGRTAVEQALALQPTDDALESAGFAALATAAFPAAAQRYDSLAARDVIDWDGYAIIEMRRYRAALAWDAAGDQGRALAGYQAFLSAWPDADPDLPAVADARRRIQAR
jgi:DNA-binding SARP family transcriptional activator/Tfp pilus assembly protein PilF